MTTKKMTTEGMVRQCFTQSWMFALGIESVPSEINHLAAAARRFVRLEDKQKGDKLHEQFKREFRVNPKNGKIVLPKHWGKLK